MIAPAPQHPQKTALVIGATGSFGGHAAVALIKHGWRVRALARDPGAAQAKVGARMPIDWVKGDAMNAADVVAAAEGASLIVHGANPPAYRNWKGTVLPMIASTIAAAEATGARIVLPGSVYNFAPDSGPAIAEDAPQVPATRKGRIRVEVEVLLREAASRGVRTLVLRAGDFFGPAAPNSGLGWLVNRAKGRVTSVYQPGKASVGHAWAYLPDLAEAMARLAEIEARLAPFEVVHFRGHWLERSGELAEAVRRVTRRPRLPIRAFPYLVVYALAPFVETMREMIEMRYLWEKPVGLDNGKLVRLIGSEPHTPLDAAVRAGLADMGCLGEVDLEPGVGAVAAA